MLAVVGTVVAVPSHFAKANEANSPGTVHKPPRTVIDFITGANPAKVTDRDALGFVMELDLFLGTSDGTGEGRRVVEGDSGNPEEYTRSWVTRNNVTRWSALDGRLVTVFSPKKVFYGVPTYAADYYDEDPIVYGLPPTREMYSIPKQRKISWVSPDGKGAPCGSECVGFTALVDNLWFSKATAARSPDRATWTFEYTNGSTLTVRADVSRGQYAVAFDNGNPQQPSIDTVTVRTVTPKQQLKVPASIVTTDASQYEKALRVAGCGGRNFMVPMQTAYGRPTADDLNRVAGTTAQQQLCTFWFPRSAGPDGAWLIKFRYNNYGPVYSFYYFPATGLVEVPEFRK